MAFDFPASPAVGDVSNGYVFNGVGWSGGPIIPTPTKQFFELAGVSTFDIPVPAWAKMAKITGRVWPGNAQYVAMRLSTDGVTFPAGAADYVDGGVLMNSGTGVYAPINTQTVNAMSLTQAGDVNQNTPTMIDTDINVWRPTTSQYFQAKHYGRSFAAAANSGHRGWLGASYPASAATVAGLRLSHLRIMNGLSGVAFGAGSFVSVEWMAGEIPQTNGTIPEAPADGNEYVRVNGVWRLKHQTIAPTSGLTFDLPVPTNAKALKLDAFVYTQTVIAGTSMGWRASLDGTTFITANDYYYTGMIHYAGSSGYGNLPGAQSTYGPLTFTSDYTISQPLRIRALLPTVRNAGNVSFSGLVHASYYNSPAANGYTDLQMGSYLLYTNLGANLQIRKFQIGNFSSGALFAPNTYFDCEWMY